MDVNFLSLFDGCHMFGHALRNVGWECVGTSEIAKHPANVTRYHYPETPQLGDCRHVDPTRIEFDCLLAGWSCQGNSVAGDRLGLDDRRSGLFSEIVRIAREGAPRWLLLENVPGMFSVNERRDFGACIGALGQLGYAVGWRVLDAQHFGVPQRRRRIFFVGCLGDPRGAAEVLFEPESVRGDSEESADQPPKRSAAGAHAPSAFNWRQPASMPNDLSPALDTDRSIAICADSVRVAMPIECERIQGLPDDWTRYGRKDSGKVYEVADSPRYEMIGNGGAVPIVEWLGRRMMQRGAQ